MSGAEQFWHVAFQEGWDRDAYLMREDEVVAHYLALDNDARGEVLELANQDCEGSCNLFNPSKHKQRHHLCDAVPKLLAMPAFSHLSHHPLPHYVWHILVHGYWGTAKSNRFRDFRSLHAVALVLIKELGLHCRGCGVTHHFHEIDACEQVFDHARCDGNPLKFYWQLGVCRSCYDLAKVHAPSRSFGDKKVQAAVDAWCRLERDERTALMRNARDDEMTTADWRAAVREPITYSIENDPLYRRKKAKPLGKKTRVWKAAYDALRELGITMEDIEQ